MARVEVHLWTGDREDVVSYVVDVAGGVANTEAAVEKARRRARQDGHEDVNLRGVDPV